MLGYKSPLLPGQKLPRQPPSQADTPPWVDAPLGRHPPGQTHPVINYGIRSTSGRYASYWYAYLCPNFSSEIDYCVIHKSIVVIVADVAVIITIITIAVVLKLSI